MRISDWSSDVCSSDLMTGGIGPDAVIDAVGMEAHGFAIDNMIDIVKQKARLGTDRASALKQAILACRKGGRVSVPGVYGGMTDKFPLGAIMEKGLQVKRGQTHVQERKSVVQGKSVSVSVDLGGRRIINKKKKKDKTRGTKK